MIEQKLTLFRYSHRMGPASAERIAGLTTRVGVELPRDYAELLSICDGIEGEIGDRYLVIDSIEVVEQFGRNEYAPHLLHIGSDGGGQAFAYDCRDAAMPIVLVPFMGYRPGDERPVAADLAALIDRLAGDSLRA